MKLWARWWLLGLLAGVVLLGVVFGLPYLVSIFPNDFPDWLGFEPDTASGSAGGTPVQVLLPAKTAWDWLQLLLVPAVLAIGGFWLTRSENRYALKTQARREAQTWAIEDRRAQDGVRRVRRIGRWLRM